MSNNWTYLSKWCFLRKLLQFFRSGSSAKNLGIVTIGPVVRNYQQWQENRLQLGELCTFILTYFFIAVYGDHHGISSNRKKVRVWVSQYGETRRTSQQKPKTQRKMTATKNDTVTICARCARMARRKCSRTSRRFRFFSWITFEAASKCGVGQAQHFYPLPERPKFGHLLENRDYKGFLQKTDWYSRAQSGTFWWFTTCGSQSSKWRMRMWISKRLRRRGARGAEAGDVDRREREATVRCDTPSAWIRCDERDGPRAATFLDLEDGRGSSRNCPRSWTRTRFGTMAKIGCSLWPISSCEESGRQQANLVSAEGCQNWRSFSSS